MTTTLNTRTARTATLVAPIDLDETFVLDVPAGVRQPDMLDEGMAHWIGADGVVRVPLDRVAKVQTVVENAERKVGGSTENSIWWARVHPSLFRIDVDTFEGEPHTAQEAWNVLEQAVSA